MSQTNFSGGGNKSVILHDKVPDFSKVLCSYKQLKQTDHINSAAIRDASIIENQNCCQPDKT